MHHRTFRKLSLLFGLVALAVFVGGCKKKVAATPPAAPPVPTPQPTVTLNASPIHGESGADGDAFLVFDERDRPGNSSRP